MSDDLFFVAEIDCHIASIDLHEAKNIHDAREQLERELFFLSQRHLRYARIVHGIGSGKLAASVHDLWKTHPLVKSWKESDDGGSCIILF